MKLKNIAEAVAFAVAPKATMRAKAALTILNSGYSRHGASTNKNSMRGWVTTTGDPDEDITENLPLLRERSRDAFMGGGLSAGAIKTVRTNVVGAGLRLNPTPDGKFLNLTPDQVKEWKAKTLREFKMWADKTDCDAARRLTFGQLQSLALVSALMNGDSFALLPVKQRVGQPYDLRIQLIEADRVVDPSNKDGKDIRGGIELDVLGESVACYIAKKHPASAYSNVETQRIEFFGKETGRPNVLHIAHDWERIGQRRGVPFLAPILETLKQLGRYQDAELMASVVSSMFTVFVKSNTPENPMGDQFPLHEQVAAGDDFAYEMGSGAIVSLGEGEDITTANPARTNSSFDAFCTSVIRQIGASLEIPYEVLIKHFTSSYSASRGALLEAWKMFKMRRTWLVQTFCQPIYEEWLAEAVAKGRIDAPGFFNDPAVRAAWCGAEWFGPTQGHLNPLQEANAAKVRIETEISTRERESAEMNGQDWAEIHAQNAREIKQMKADGTLKNVADYEPEAIEVIENE